MILVLFEGEKYSYFFFNFEEINTLNLRVKLTGIDPSLSQTNKPLQFDFRVVFSYFE